MDRPALDPELARLLAQLPASAFGKRSAPSVGAPPPGVERRTAVQPSGPLQPVKGDRKSVV